MSEAAMDVVSSGDEYDQLKELGNASYRLGDYANAIQYFTQAIQQHPNEVIYTNRSLCYSAMNQWEESLADANKALQMNSKYMKAYYRVIKAYIELQRITEAKSCVLLGYKQCGETKELKALEEEIFVLTGIPTKLSINDFHYIEDLGEGNFTRIFSAELKKTKQIYVIKSVEKETIDKIRKRHKNVNNEILMEKRALSKLNHVNIVKLFSTFQDPSTLTLYYHMEYFSGGEVWKLLRDPIDQDGHHVGCYWNLARYFIAATIDAIEYMHRKGIVHRDLKPENMMIVSIYVLSIAF
jgi:tetratricopeptide (TPR) repeat protein